MTLAETTAEASGITLLATEQHLAPFRYVLAERCIAPALERALLDWFETEAPWRLVETDFYEQYEFSVLDQMLPASVEPLAEGDGLATIRAAMESLFEVRLDRRMMLVAHKLLPGQRIAIHNDYLVGEETHRLTVQLNRGLSDEDGGLFMLFNSFDTSDIHRILRPVSGSAIAFAISPDSHHAVSRLHGGERYTLVYSFYAQ
jgi:hypothetical protein